LAGDNGSELVLASGSLRRQDLLREAGISFRVVVPSVDETLHPGEKPEESAQRLATLKARTVARTLPPKRCVLAADTLVVVGHQVLGKPRDTTEAAHMLLTLAGRTHRVLTAFAVLRSGTDPTEVSLGFEESQVRMRSVSEDEAHAYAETGEPLDKAGAYALQGIGARFVESVEGSRSNVIGLPLERVLPLLASEGIVATEGNTE
jgi:septum formation protein